MDAPELRLKCLELAMEQAKREGMHADRKAVAEILNQFYSLVVGKSEEPGDTPKPNKHSKTPAGKEPEIFR